MYVAFILWHGNAIPFRRVVVQHDWRGGVGRSRLAVRPVVGGPGGRCDQRDFARRLTSWVAILS